jgi:antirestriction protein ArdC
MQPAARQAFRRPCLCDRGAELGAAFLCADLKITDEPRADHAQYLASWLAVLKADKKAMFTAASKASEAAAFLAALQARLCRQGERPAERRTEEVSLDEVERITI